MPTSGVLGEIEPNLLTANKTLALERRAEMGQFLTPPPVATFMASLLGLNGKSVRVLDAGAGVGTLTAAVAQEVINREVSPKEVRSIAYELDVALMPHLRDVLKVCRDACGRGGVDFCGEAWREDFIMTGVAALSGEMFAPGGPLLESFDCAILNPPYRKLNKDSAERRALRTVGIDVGNLYAAFLALAVELLKPGGELVAITPRSFCNGPYFRPFRKRFLERMSLRRLHVFDAHDRLFGDNSVLQENVVIHAVKGSVGEETMVVVSTSTEPDEDPLLFEREYEELVHPDDPEAFIRVVPDEGGELAALRMAMLGCSLQDLETSVSTGPVVDFRAQDLLRREPSDDTVPLIYPHNLRDGLVEWPKEHAKKPQAILGAPAAQGNLVPSGVYVLVKRFSAKEERRRVVAAVYEPERLDIGTPAGNGHVGFENHLNYYHRGGSGLPRAFARALAAFLNSTLVDLYFRQFSGHTQVNATDLRNFPYPSRQRLEAMGAEIEEVFGEATPNQTWVDGYLEERLQGMAEGTGNPAPAQAKIEEAKEVLKAIGMPRAQQNDRSALTLLALLNLRPRGSRPQTLCSGLPR